MHKNGKRDRVTHTSLLRIKKSQKRGISLKIYHRKVCAREDNSTYIIISKNKCTYDTTPKQRRYIVGVKR